MTALPARPEIGVRCVRPVFRNSGRARSLVCAFVCFVLTGGCAPVRTEINSFVDPDFTERTYQRILITPRYEDLGMRSATEAAFGEELSRSRTAAIPSMQVLLPTREWKDDEIFTMMSERNIDAVLLITQTGYFSEREYVPEFIDVDTDEYLTSRTLRPRRGWQEGRVRTRTRATRTGGYYVDLPRLRHQLQLYDVASRRMVWYASALTAGDSSATEQQMIQSLARESIARLGADGLVRMVENDTDD